MLPLALILACADANKDSDTSDVAQPGSEPAAQPGSEPATQPSSEPSSQPASEPSSQPSSEPSSQPSSEPSSQPSAEPSSQPSSEPSSEVSYTGGYNTNPCTAQTTGYGVGQVAGDFSLLDQYGETLTRSDFCNNTVLLVSAAFW